MDVFSSLDAYGRNLEHYLFFLRKAGVQPWNVKQDHVALYLHSLLAISVTAEKESRLANATIQQHLTTFRLFQEYLLAARGISNWFQAATRNSGGGSVARNCGLVGPSSSMCLL